MTLNLPKSILCPLSLSHPLHGLNMMAEESSFKRQKVEEIDRISTLPDSVLCHILSFLPTITCVTTMSLVSRRWRYLWEHLQVFDFYLKYNKRSSIDNKDEEFEKFEKFVAFVNSVLSVRRSSDIRKMSLSFGQPQVDDFFSNYVDSWIRTAAGHQLQELHLTLFCMDTIFQITRLVSCTNLSSLSVLSGDIAGFTKKVQHCWLH